jgi:dephospho-CoA kinase
MKVLGLTGGIAMGKSTVAGMFAARGIPVFDADAVVRALYAKNGAAVALVEQAFPGAVIGGAVDRAKLAELVLDDDAALKRLEAIVHPLVRHAEQAFLAAARAKGARLAVLEIPLLFESGGAMRCDRVAVVSAPKPSQRARALARPGMSAEKFRQIVTRQLSDADKRQRADFVIPTGGSLAETDAAVAAVIAALTGEPPGRG